MPFSICPSRRFPVKCAVTSNLRRRQGYAMSDERPKCETMSIEEATISNMWEMAAIVEVLEQKGLCTK